MTDSVVTGDLPTDRDAVWQLRLLGGLRLDDGQRTLNRLPSRAITALLARLALAPGKAHAREELVELLWPGVALDVGRNRLRQSLSTLKSILEPLSRTPPRAVLLADRTHVRVAPGAWWCDVVAFERAVRAGDAGLAVTLYGGELLPGIYDAWIDDERTRLAAVHDRIASSVAVAAASAVNPVVSPSAITTPSRVGASRPLPAPRVDVNAARIILPTYLTRMFGAEAQAATLRDMVQAQRLVTLVGPGGAGKTRLAIEVAHSLRAHAGWPLPVTDPQEPYDLIALVALVSCSHRAQALDAIAAALFVVPGARDPLQAVVDALQGRRALLVLDNFEQLVGWAEDIVAHLVAQVSTLHVLVTSRRALGLSGEHELALSALALPPLRCDLAAAAANPAVALFVERAQSVRSDFHLNVRNASALVDLVRELEGMPLAIELAASRVRSLSPSEMLERLQGSGTPRLALLARSGARHATDARHASMQRVVAWSWTLLSAEQAHLLGALTVFAGGFTAASARMLMVDENVDAGLLLDDLLAHSLVHSPEVADELRFSIYQPVREFALTQMASAMQRHWRSKLRAWALAWAQALPPTPALPTLRSEMPNLVAAIASAVEDGANDEAVTLLLHLRLPLEVVELPTQGLRDAITAVERCSQASLRARGHSVLAQVLFKAGQRDAAMRHAELGLQRDGLEPTHLAFALHTLARMRWQSLRQASVVEPLVDEAQSLADTLGLRELQARLCALRGFVAHGHHHDDQASERLHTQALLLWTGLGNDHATHGALYNLAACAENMRQPELARQRIDPLIAQSRAWQDWHLLTRALNVRGNALADLRQWPDALADYQECVRVAWHWTGPFDLAYGLWNLPRTLAHLGRAHDALRLMAFAAQDWVTHFGLLTASDQHAIRLVRRLCARQLAGASADALWHEGERMSLAQAVSMALTRT